MKILSWDVGIKNLAYCIIEFNGDEFKILKWDIIDLLDDRLKCCHQLKGCKGSCNKIAKHVFKINECNEQEEKYYCKAHIKKLDYKIIEVCDGNKITCCKCKKNCIKLVEGSNYGWCEKHCEKNIDIYKRRCLRKINQQCTKQSLVKLGESMYNKLDEIPEMMDVKMVLIENQPVLKNPTMKSVACMLFSYFVMRGICEKKGKFEKNDIRFISASGKLKINKDSKNKLKKGKNEKDVYNITKGLGVTYTKAIIEDKDNKYLDKYKKKDDLCDAFLQAIRVYYEDNIPTVIANKLATIKNNDKNNDKINDKNNDKINDKIIKTK